VLSTEGHYRKEARGSPSRASSSWTGAKGKAEIPEDPGPVSEGVLL
jgi:hypothetical protein